MLGLELVNTLRPRQNGCHFPDEIFRCIFSMKMYKFWLKFHRSLFVGVQLTIFQYWLRQWLGTNQATSLCLNQWRLVYWRIYTSLGRNELKGLPIYGLHLKILWDTENPTMNIGLCYSYMQLYCRIGNLPAKSSVISLILHLGFWISLSLTHSGWVMHICVSKLTIIGSDSALSPGRRQAIISTNSGILLIGPLGTVES